MRQPPGPSGALPHVKLKAAAPFASEPVAQTWYLPLMPVATPASLRNPGILRTPAFAEKCWTFWQSPYMPFSCVAMPVRSDARDGEHELTDVYAASNVVPCDAAKASSLGVARFASP